MFGDEDKEGLVHRVRRLEEVALTVKKIQMALFVGVGTMILNTIVQVAADYVQRKP